MATEEGFKKAFRDYVTIHELSIDGMFSEYFDINGYSWVLIIMNNRCSAISYWLTEPGSSVTCLRNKRYLAGNQTLLVKFVNDYLENMD